MNPFGTDIWSADGNFEVTADGFPGWTADGWEPNPLSQAVNIIHAAGFNVGQITPVYHPYIPAGWVITPYPGLIATQPFGTYFNLTISQGPAPVPPTPPVIPIPKTTVPNVVGKFYVDAQLAILGAALLTAPPTWALSSTIKPQYVISQSIAAGTRVNQQTQMTIVVSGFPVPNQGVGVVPVP